jgi:hypothetical protein
MAPKIKEDPPELKSKVDSTDIKTPVTDEYDPDYIDDNPKEAFKEVTEPSPTVSPDVALLMEQNRILMEKLEALTAKPEETEAKVKEGIPVLDKTRPIIYQRSEGAAWKEQDGNRFSQKDSYIGPVE